MTPGSCVVTITYNIIIASNLNIKIKSKSKRRIKEKNRKIESIIFDSDSNSFNNTSTIIADNDNYINVDREPPRGRSNVLSVISSRKVSTHSSISSIPYIKRIEIQNNNLS